MQKIAIQQDEFEQSFFNLAYEQLQNKLYNLLPYLVGFELVNKNEDNTKAVGVFGFKSNTGHVLYVPVFFINGEVKGLSILYSKNNEQFYPLNEDFASLFLNDDSTDVGEPSNQSREQINKDVQGLDLRDFLMAPRTGRTVMASVLDYVKDASPLVKKAFMGFMEKDAEYLESLIKFYPLEKIAEAVSAKHLPGDKFRKDTDLKVVMYNGHAEDRDMYKDLTAKEKEQLLTKGYFIIDKRSDKQVAEFGMCKYQEKFGNPVESGFYSYVTKAAGLQYGLVLTKLRQFQQYFATDDSIVINIDDARKYSYVVDTHKVFVKDNIKVNDLKGAYDMMIEPSEGKPGYSQKYILINDKLEATVPFHIVANFKDQDGLRRIQVSCETIYDRSHLKDKDTNESLRGPFDAPGSAHQLPRSNAYKHTLKKNEYTLILTKRIGGRLDLKGETIFVPKGYKLMPLDFADDQIAHMSIASSDVESKKRNEENAKQKAYAPGCIGDLYGALGEHFIMPMTVRNNGSEYFVDVPQFHKKYTGEQEAKIGMVLDYGLTEKTAEQIISALVGADNMPINGLYKRAYTGEYYGQLPPSPEWTNVLGQPEAGTYESETPVPHMPSWAGDPTRIGSGDKGEVKGLEDSLHNASQLAQNGQKELFDTQSIATLSKYVDATGKIKEYMPDFVSALDKLGRMLFLIYWETDKFEEQYGRTELPELVELLTNVFKNLGDLVILFKRKSPDLSISSSKDQLDV